MKKFILFLPLLTIISCQKQSQKTIYDLSEQFREDITQRFTFQADDEAQEFITKEDIVIQIDPAKIRVDGVQPSGQMTLEFIAIYDKGTMALANRPTMGINEFNEQAMMVSGGEYYVNVTNDDRKATINSLYSLNIPYENVEADMNKMKLYQGVSLSNNNLSWVDYNSSTDGTGISISDGGYYHIYLDQFTWINCDYFYDNPYEKTSIGADLTDSESMFFLSIDSMPNTLASLKGEYPIGIKAHLICIAENNDEYSYLIEPITIERNSYYQYKLKDLKPMNKNALIEKINNLP